MKSKSQLGREKAKLLIIADNDSHLESVKQAINGAINSVSATKQDLEVEGLTSLAAYPVINPKSFGGAQPFQFATPGPRVSSKQGDSTLPMIHQNPIFDDK